MKKFVPYFVAILSLFVGALVFRAMQFDFKTLDGKTWRLNQLEGKWVIVNHFAQWCAPCLEEVPELNLLAKRIQGEDIALFAVSYDEMSDQALRDIRDKYNMKFHLVEQKYAQGIPGIKPKQLPATYILSPQGIHVETVLGKQTAGSLLDVIEAMKEK